MTKYFECKTKAIKTLKLRGFDYQSLSWKEKVKYRSMYLTLVKEQLEKKVKDLFDMLEIKLFRIAVGQENSILEIKRKQSIVAITCCVVLFLVVVVKEVMI